MNANPNQQQSGGGPYPMASLYVGDLDPDVSETILFEKFSQAGTVLSIRVCRDMLTRRSLGYAYVNFQQPADAKRAYDTMNFDTIKGRPMRIMWSQRDPSLRKSDVGNIFIKNLDKSIDNKYLFDLFSAFGDILSCKIMVDEHAVSKGYGFVHFETEEAACNAIERVNGMLLNTKKVFVGHFVPRKERLDHSKHEKYTTVFIKNFSEDYDEEKLRELFSTCGTITSLKLMTDEVTGNLRRFGFVSFDKPEQAERAVDELNGKDMGEGRPTLYVGRAHKKFERQQELREKYEKLKEERMQRWAGMNLYVKNLDDTVDDELLREEFSKHGTVTSARVMVEGGRSTGFGFVCYSSPEEAARAVTEMNGRIIGKKPLYVARAQRKEDRKQQLTSQYMQRMTLMPRMPPNQMDGQQIYHHPQPTDYVEGATATQRPGASSFDYAQQPMPAAGMNVRQLDRCLGQQPQSVQPASFQQANPPVPSQPPPAASKPKAEGDCCVCFEREVNCVLIKCGHLCMCFACAQDIQADTGRCPICREKFDDVIKTFRACTEL